MRRFQHSDTLLKSFLVVNPQDLYLVRIPKQSHVVKLTKATLPDFVHAFLKVGAIVPLSSRKRRSI